MSLCCLTVPSSPCPLVSLSPGPLSLHPGRGSFSGGAGSGGQLFALRPFGQEFPELQDAAAVPAFEEEVLEIF